jgi:8-oxo-dGTP pyrophosphatase MutT (NUDIX family)
MATTEDKRTQYGSLPYKVEANGSLLLLLVTSRDTKRWVIPKGWPIKEMKPHEAASVEAFEEAGARGTADKQAVGSYVYRKRLSRSSITCEVELYPLKVEKLERAWPEKLERKRQWFDAESAASLVDEPSLASLIRSFALAKNRRKQKQERP